MKSKSVTVLALSLAMGGFLLVTHAQQSYTPTDDQTLDLRLKALDFQKADLMWQQAAQHIPAYIDRQKALEVYRAEAAKIVKDNKWPETVHMNEQTGLFINSVPEPPAPAAPAKK